MFQIQFPSDSDLCILSGQFLFEEFLKNSDLRILSGQYVGIHVNNPYRRQPDCITDSG